MVKGGQIRSEQPMALAEQTAEFGVTSGSMSTMIDRLLMLGMIDRKKNPEDRRGNRISLTAQGETILTEVRDVWQDVDELIEEKLGPEKAARLTELSRELKLALGGRVPGKRLRSQIERQPERSQIHET